MCLLTQRDPFHTAKETATLDYLSGGRFVFGVGAGWNREEMGDHGTNPATRMRLLRERVLAVRELWTKEEAEFRGQMSDFARSYQWPKPVQQPAPPVLVGGAGPTVFDRVLDYGDGWLPNPTGRSGEEVVNQIAELHRIAAERGRQPVAVTVFACPPEHAEIERYREAGAGRCLFLLPATGRDDALRELDRLAGVMAGA